MLRELFCLVSFSFLPLPPPLLSLVRRLFFSFPSLSLALSPSSRFFLFLPLPLLFAYVCNDAHEPMTMYISLQQQQQQCRWEKRWVEKNAMHATTLPLFHRPTLLLSLSVLALFFSLSLALPHMYMFTIRRRPRRCRWKKKMSCLHICLRVSARAPALCVNVIVKKAITHLGSTWKRGRGRFPLFALFMHIWAIMW